MGVTVPLDVPRVHINRLRYPPDAWLIPTGYVGNVDYPYPPYLRGTAGYYNHRNLNGLQHWYSRWNRRIIPVAWDRATLSDYYRNPPKDMFFAHLEPLWAHYWGQHNYSGCPWVWAESMPETHPALRGRPFWCLTFMGYKYEERASYEQFSEFYQGLDIHLQLFYEHQFHFRDTLIEVPRTAVLHSIRFRKRL